MKRHTSDTASECRGCRAPAGNNPAILLLSRAKLKQRGHARRESELHRHKYWQTTGIHKKDEHK